MKKIKEKIMFSSSAVTLASYGLVCLLHIPIIYFLYLFVETANGFFPVYKFFIIYFCSFIAYLIVLPILFHLTYTNYKEYDDFANNLNDFLKCELADELSRLQGDFKIDIKEYYIFALNLCQRNYKKGKLNEILINKTKNYYINFFRKKIAKQLKEEQQEFNLKSNQEMILKKIG